MSWPRDPERYAATMERFKKAQSARWTPEARAKAAEKTIKQFSNPEAREKMSQVKKEFFQKNPEAREQLSKIVKEKCERDPEPLKTARAALAEKHKRKKIRLALIRARSGKVTKCQDESRKRPPSR